MDFIEGQNLTEIVALKDFDFWSDGLEIVKNICKHLEYSHNLPQAVLHRDVRPSNVMIPHFHWSDMEAADHGIDRFRAVLLNYDMSWHLNAKGQTIAGNLEEAGFYAPELLENAAGAMARRTSVDSYGLGMTLFYAFTKQVPPSGGSKSTDWEDILKNKFRRNAKLGWMSAPERLRRIIRDATKPDDDSRSSIKNIRSRLNALSAAVKGNLESVSLDLWAEELISRATESNYDADPEEFSFSREYKAGRSIRCKADFSRKRVDILFTNIATESTDRVRAVKTWGEKLRTSQEILKSGGWLIGTQTSGRNLSILLSASISFDDLRENFEKMVLVLNKGLDQIRLD